MESIGADAAFMAAAAGKAFVTLMEPHRLMYLMAGCMMGLVLGIVPGIGGLAGTAMLLPFTFGMDPYSAFALLLGLGATTATGDPIPAILFGVPGGAASAATVLDGFPMAKRGEAGRALSAAYMSSMMGGIFGAMLLAVSIPILRPVMLYLGSPELLAFSVLGISMVAVLSGSAPLRGVAAGCLGIMIAMIGSDPQTGTLRWTMDSLYLWDGLPLTPVLLGLFALPELCDLLIARTTISKEIDKDNIYKGQWQGVKDCFDNWWLIVRCSWIGGGIGSIPGISASVVDWLAYGHALKTEKGAQPDLRQGRRARRDRVGKLQQRQGGRRAGSDRGVRRARQRHHGDPARRLPHPRARAGPGHAAQESRHHLRDGVVGGARQHPRRRRLLRVQPAVRAARDAALHADPAGGAEHRLHRRVRSLAELGRPVRAAAVRRVRLADEAVQVAAAAAGAGPRARRHASSATCSSRSSATASPGSPVRWWRSCWLMAIIGVVRPFLADVRRQGGIGKLLSSFQAPTFQPQQLFTMFFIALIGMMVASALPWAFAAKLVPMIVGTLALLVAGVSLFNELCRKPTAAAGGSLVDQAQAEVEQTIHADEKIHMDLESDTGHLPLRTIVTRVGAVLRLSPGLHGSDGVDRPDPDGVRLRHRLHAAGRARNAGS